ncbi:lysozyme inhibitor LprI family protein [Gemmatirosa kalamazoonensis]|nr:lysozyme inhibitor LprI family protein [Gemmatirosa kalamazoonensis]
MSSRARMAHLGPLFALALGAAPLRAQPARDGDAPCAEASTQLELTGCWSDAAKHREAAAAATYDSVRARLRGRERATTLRLVTQSRDAWRRARDLQCAAARSLYGAGSAAPMVAARCRAALADQWATWLRAEFLSDDDGK